MIRWIRALFKAPPVAPVPSPGIYRKAKEPTKAVTRPVTETLFERPADLPPAAPIDIVQPTTEADRYRWLDYQNPPVPAPAPVPQTDPYPVETNWPAAASGAIWVTGHMLCWSGSYLTDVFTGVCHDFTPTGAQPIQPIADSGHLDYYTQGRYSRPSKPTSQWGAFSG